jgi:hypothetical protein
MGQALKRLARFGIIAALGFSGWTAAAATVAPHAAACTIPPSSSPCSPDALAVSTASTLVQKVNGTDASSCANPGDCYTVDWVENVMRDPNNVFCSNCLDWLVQATMESNSQSSALISRITVSSFANFRTDIGIDTNPAPAGSQGLSNSGTQSPNQVERDATQRNIAWDFTLSSNEITPGKTTVLLVVETNATNVVPGTISFQNGETAGDVALAPAIPDAVWVPALGLLGGALAGGAVTRRRRRAR